MLGAGWLVHDVKLAAGPILKAGFDKSAAGALQWRWSCSRCGQLAQYNSRLVELLRTPCGGQGE